MTDGSLGRLPGALCLVSDLDIASLPVCWGSQHPGVQVWGKSVLWELREAELHLQSCRRVLSAIPRARVPQAAGCRARGCQAGAMQSREQAAARVPSARWVSRQHHGKPFCCPSRLRRKLQLPFRMKSLFARVFVLFPPPGKQRWSVALRQAPGSHGPFPCPPRAATSRREDGEAAAGEGGRPRPRSAGAERGAVQLHGPAAAGTTRGDAPQGGGEGWMLGGRMPGAFLWPQ